MLEGERTHLQSEIQMRNAELSTLRAEFASMCTAKTKTDSEFSALQIRSTEQCTRIAELEASLKKQEDDNSELTQRMRKLNERDLQHETQRRKLHNKIQELRVSNICWVVCKSFAVVGFSALQGFD